MFVFFYVNVYIFFKCIKKSKNWRISSINLKYTYQLANKIKFRTKIMALVEVEECDIGISKTWSIVMEAKCTKCSRKSWELVYTLQPTSTSRNDQAPSLAITIKIRASLYDYHKAEKASKVSREGRKTSGWHTCDVSRFAKRDTNTIQYLHLYTHLKKKIEKNEA